MRRDVMIHTNALDDKQVRGPICGEDFWTVAQDYNVFSFYDSIIHVPKALVAGRNFQKNSSYLYGAEPVEVTSQDVRAIIQQCARGDRAARIAFQEEYGPLIDSFPVRVFHLSEADAGEFYLYAFEKDRIFQRIRTFEGRNAIQFTTYLSFYVLRDLFLEWLRTRKAERGPR